MVAKTLSRPKTTFDGIDDEVRAARLKQAFVRREDVLLLILIRVHAPILR